MASAGVQEPFLCDYEDSSEEECFIMSSARCDPLAPWLDAFPGERAMNGHPTAPLMSEATESRWYERTQDMTGFMFPDSILLPSDEQSDFSFSSVQHENDLDMINSENPSPAEYILSSQADAVLEDNSNMFENYSEIDSDIKQPSIEFVFSATETLLSRTDSENSLIFPTAREDKKQPSAKKSGKLSAFDFEEPYIKEEAPPSCIDSKLTDMEVAAEEEVVTEPDDDCKEFQSQPTSNIYLGSHWLHSPLQDIPEVPKQEIFKPIKSLEETSLFGCDSSTMDSHFNFPQEELGPDDWAQQLLIPSPSLPQGPPLQLDIERAMMPVELLYGEGLPDTPEVMQTVLNPSNEFDLVSFLLNVDPNNNSTLSSSSKAQTSKANPSSERRRGKSQLTLQELKASQSSQPRPVEIQCDDAIPGPSNYTYTTSVLQCERLSPVTASTTTTNRPRRESATRFNRLLEEGLLTSNSEAHSVISDNDDCSVPKSKRRRTVSSSSRGRLTSDSEQSSVGDLTRYRERRDRNNLSSQRSRQKRKQAQEMQRLEEIDLEEKNKRLVKKEAKLAAILVQINEAWKEYMNTLTQVNTHSH